MKSETKLKTKHQAEQGKSLLRNLASYGITHSIENEKVYGIKAGGFNSDGESKQRNANKVHKQ